MNFIKRWRIRKELKKAASENDELAQQLNQELVATQKEYMKTLREAKTRNQIIEAQRRIDNLKQETEEYEDDEDEEDDEDDEFNPEKIIEKLMLQAVQKKLNPINAPIPLNSEKTLDLVTPIKKLAIDKIMSLDDANLEQLAKKFL